MDEGIKASLKEDLDKQNTPETVKSFIEDLELSADAGYEEILSQARAKLETLSGQMNAPIPSLDEVNTRVEGLGGSPDALKNEVGGVDTELAKNEEDIKNTESETLKKIEELNTTPIQESTTLEGFYQNLEEEKGEVKENVNDVQTENPVETQAKKNNAEITSQSNTETPEPAAVEKSENFSEKAKYFSEQAAKKFEESNDRYSAAYEYRSLGNEEKFKELMRQLAEKNETEGEFIHAAWDYEKVGDEGKYREMMNIFAEKEEMGKNFDRAAEYYEKAGNQEKAKEINLKEAKEREESANFHLNAIKDYEKMYETADEQDKEKLTNQIKEQNNSYADYTFFAGRSYEKAGNQEKAKESFQKVIQNFEEKPELNRSELERLAESYTKIGNQEKAKETYLKFAEESYKANNLERAAEIYIMLGDDKRAQELAEEEAKRYQDLLQRTGGGREGNYKEISEIYKRAGNIEMSDRYNNYAEEDKKRGNNHQASIAESQHQYSTAVDYYKVAGNKEKMKEMANKIIDGTKQLTEEERQKLHPRELHYIAKAYKILESN